MDSGCGQLKSIAKSHVVLLPHVKMRAKVDSLPHVVVRAW